jgi:hypothetical protein
MGGMTHRLQDPAGPRRRAAPRAGTHRHARKPRQIESAGGTIRYILQALLFFVRLLALSGAALFTITLTTSSGAQAATTVCSAIWTPPNGIPGQTKSAPIQGSDPSCPASSITAIVTVGTGLNAGSLNSSGATWNTDLGTNQFNPTSDSGIAIGSPAATSTDLSLTFSQPAINPYFFASYLNGGETLTFTTPFSILQSNAVTFNGLSATGSGPDSDRNSGFVAQFLGSYTSIGFKYTNTNSQAVSFAFTTGVTPPPSPAPGPLPILGLGAALSQCRKLRRLTHQRRGHALHRG